MEQNQTSFRKPRVIKINPFLSNIGQINITFLLISLVISYFFILSIVMFFFYLDFNKDYFLILTEVQNDIQIIFNYFITNIINLGTKIIDFINLISQKTIIPKIDFQPTKLPKFNVEGWIMLIISFILTINLYISYFLQIKYQRILKELGVENYYIPIFFIYTFLKRFKTKKAAIKVISVLKLEQIRTSNKDQIKLIKQVLFNIKNEDLDLYDFDIEIKSYFNWYHIQIWKLVKKEPIEKPLTKKEELSKVRRLTRKQKKEL